MPAAVVAADAGRVGGMLGLKAVYLGTGREKLRRPGPATSANPAGGSLLRQWDVALLVRVLSLASNVAGAGRGAQALVG